MSLPINWQSVATPTVGRTNLLSTSVAPFTRLVDPSLSSDEGNAYNDLQSAWNACSDGDSIFVKAGLQSGGLTVNSGAANNKNNIRIYCESPWSHNSGTDAAYWTTKWVVEDCNGVQVHNAVVRGATGTGFQFTNCDDVLLDHVVSQNNTSDGFLITQTSSSCFTHCISRGNSGRGWIVYDGITECTWEFCSSSINGSHGFAWGQFPATNAASFYNKVIGCSARDNNGSGDGFNFIFGQSGSTYGFTQFTIMGNTSRGNAGDGFSYDYDQTVEAVICGNTSTWNTGAGIRRTGSGALSATSFNGNVSAGNTAGNLVGSLAGAIGYDQNGLSAPGTNRIA